MPRIREYVADQSSRVSAPGRRASGEDFGSSGGLLAAGKAIAGVGDIVQDNAERQEVSDVRTKLAQARAEWTLQLHERATTGAVGDPEFASKFNADFAAHLDKLGGGVKTRSGELAFRQGAGELSAHFVGAAGLHQAHSAGLKAKQDYTVALDAWRNTLINDPTQHDSILREGAAALNDPRGPYARLSAEDREKLANQTKRELALSAVQGTIRLSPELALKQLKDGRWANDLDADRTHYLTQHAQVGINAKRIEEERLERQVEQDRKVYTRAVQEEIVQKLGTGKLTVRDVLNSDLPAVGDGSKEHFLAVLNTRSKEAAERPIKTVPSVMLGLFERIHLPVDDPRKIRDEVALNDAYIGGKLSFEDFSRLRKEVTENRTDEGQKFGQAKANFLKRIEPQILRASPMTGVLLDPTSGNDMLRFEAHVARQVEAYKKAGKDPYDLFNPDKPDYLGGPKVVSQYAKTFTQAVDAATRRLAPVAVPKTVEAGRPSLDDIFKGGRP